jgi:metal transporter CNNM
MEFGWDEILNIAMVLICVLCAALAAGLTMGLLSLAPRNLQVKAMIGEEEEAKAAESVLPLIHNHHLLLVTLLLFNAVANEALPVFLGKVVPEFAAVLISVTLVLIFGEV